MNSEAIKNSFNFENDDSSKLLQLYDAINEYIKYLDSSILEAEDEI